MKKIIAIIICCFAVLVLISGCKPENDISKTDNSLQKVLESGKLILGLDDGFPPMGFVNENGEIDGFDIDVAKEVCKRLNIKLETKGIDWNSKENILNSGEIDCIWNGLSITPSRAEEMSLSEPYMKNEMIFVVSGTSDIKGIRDLDGKTVGIQSGSTSQEMLMKSSIHERVTIMTYDSNITLLEQLKNEVIDVVLVDSVVAYYFIFSEEKTFFILSESLGEEKYAIAFRKKDKALRDKIQEIISEMKADGTLGEISKKWFGSDITIVR